MNLIFVPSSSAPLLTGFSCCTQKPWRRSWFCGLTWSVAGTQGSRAEPFPASPSSELHHRLTPKEGPGGGGVPNMAAAIFASSEHGGLPKGWPELLIKREREQLAQGKDVPLVLAEMSQGCSAQCWVSRNYQEMKRLTKKIAQAGCWRALSMNSFSNQSWANGFMFSDILWVF